MLQQRRRRRGMLVHLLFLLLVLATFILSVYSKSNPNSPSLRRIKQEFKNAVEMGIAYDWVNQRPIKRKRKGKGKRKRKEEKESLSRKDKNDAILCLGPITTNLRQWHFSFRGAGDLYGKGIYHGVILLPNDYPHSPPQVEMWTPSGRFIPNKAICLSASNFHPESWTPRWNIHSMVNALRLHMLTKPGEIGSMTCDHDQIVEYAQESLAWKAAFVYTSANEKKTRVVIDHSLLLLQGILSLEELETAKEDSDNDSDKLDEDPSLTSSETSARESTRNDDDDELEEKGTPASSNTDVEGSEDGVNMVYVDVADALVKTDIIGEVEEEHLIFSSKEELQAYIESRTMDPDELATFRVEYRRAMDKVFELENEYNEMVLSKSKDDSLLLDRHVVAAKRRYATALTKAAEYDPCLKKAAAEQKRQIANYEEMLKLYQKGEKSAPDSYSDLEDTVQVDVGIFSNSNDRDSAFETMVVPEKDIAAIIVEAKSAPPGDGLTALEEEEEEVLDELDAMVKEYDEIVSNRDDYSEREMTAALRRLATLCTKAAAFSPPLEECASKLEKEAALREELYALRPRLYAMDANPDAFSKAEKDALNDRRFMINDALGHLQNKSNPHESLNKLKPKIYAIRENPDAFTEDQIAMFEGMLRNIKEILGIDDDKLAEELFSPSSETTPSRDEVLRQVEYYKALNEHLFGLLEFNAIFKTSDDFWKEDCVAASERCARLSEKAAEVEPKLKNVVLIEAIPHRLYIEYHATEAKLRAIEANPHAFLKKEVIAVINRRRVIEESMNNTSPYWPPLLDTPLSDSISDEAADTDDLSEIFVGKENFAEHLRKVFEKSDVDSFLAGVGSGHRVMTFGVPKIGKGRKDRAALLGKPQEEPPTYALVDRIVYNLAEGPMLQALETELDEELEVVFDELGAMIANVHAVSDEEATDILRRFDMLTRKKIEFNAASVHESERTSRLHKMLKQQKFGVNAIRKDPHQFSEIEIARVAIRLRAIKISLGIVDESEDDVSMESLIEIILSDLDLEEATESEGLPKEVSFINAATSSAKKRKKTKKNRIKRRPPTSSLSKVVQILQAAIFYMIIMMLVRNWS